MVKKGPRENENPEEQDKDETSVYPKTETEETKSLVKDNSF